MPTPDETPLPPLDITLTTGEAPANPDGDWLTVSEAVARTKASERTVRRWVEDGKVETRRQGNRLLLWLPSPGTTPEAAVTQQIALIERQAELIERLSQRQAELAEQQAAPLREMVKEQAERLAALERENGRLEAELAQARRSWWDRLLGR